MIKIILPLSILVAFIISASAQNTVSFDNQSGELALVKLIGPTSTEIQVPDATKQTVQATAGKYIIKVRYGVQGKYHYTKGQEFTVDETATTTSKITITLHKVVNGNYDSRPISEQEFGVGQNKDDATAFLTAVVEGKVDQVKALIAAGADVNAKDAKGMTALILAVFTDNAKCLEALISAHADVNAKEGGFGNTALITAAKKGNAGFVKALIAARADVNAKNDSGYTALMYAPDVENAKVLIAAGADVNAKDTNGGTALLGATLAKDADRVKALIAAGADVNAKDNTGWAPLMGAASKGCADCIKALITAGAGSVVNATDVSGNTALIYAAHSGSLDSVKALIEAGADVNAKNNEGMTALGAATSEDVTAILRSGQSKDNSTKETQAADTKDNSTNATHVVVVGSSTASDAMADKEWDAIKDDLAPGLLKDFLTKYPHYRGVEDKKIFLSLEEQMEQIRVQKSKPDFSISFEALPAQWSRWRKDYYYLSVISIDSEGAMGLAGGFSGRFDDNGNYTLPTKSGSIFIFEPKAQNANWSKVGKVLFNGVTLITPACAPITVQPQNALVKPIKLPNQPQEWKIISLRELSHTRRNAAMRDAGAGSRLLAGVCGATPIFQPRMKVPGGNAS